MAQVTPTTALEAAFSRPALAEAWELLKKAKTDPVDGRVKIPPGWDRVTVPKFERQLTQHLAAIERKVLSGRYTFRPFLYHDVPKVDGGTRRIAYSGIRDRVVQAALHNYFASAVDARLSDSAFAYRSGLGPHDAIRHVYSSITGGRPFFVKSDFVQFFDRLDHARLEKLLDTMDIDPRARTLGWRFVRTGHVPRDAARSGPFPPSRERGVPQGGVISGVLANLYLAEFDLTVRAVPAATLIRYADDFVIFCSDPETCKTALGVANKAAEDALLELHEDKTVRCGHINNDGLNFVGFRIRGTRVSIKHSNVAKFKQRMDKVLLRHESKFREGDYPDADTCIRQAVWHISRKLRGVEVGGIRRSWIVFFRIVNDVQQVRQLDRWLWNRFACLAQRLGLPYRTRSQILELGYRSLLNEYWRARRTLTSVALAYRGTVP